VARNKHPEETRNRIIDVSLKLFMEKGYESTSIQDILNHLDGLSKGAIYHHFKSKEDILLAVTEKLYDGQEPDLEVIRSKSSLNGRDKLKAMLQTSINHPGQSEMFSVAPNLLKNPQMLSLILEQTVVTAKTFVQPIVEEGIRDGSITTSQPRQLTEAFLLLSNIWLNPMVFPCEFDEFRDRFRFVQEMFKKMGADCLDDKVLDQLEQYNLTFTKKNK